MRVIMNLVLPPVQPDTAPPDDELDGLLRAYFQAQMPRPWPALVLPQDRNGVLPLARPPVAPSRLPAREAKAGDGRRPLFRSRLALAASVALLILGPLYLSGKFESGGGTSPGISVKEAEGKGKPKTNSRLWLDQEPDRGTAIKVEVLELEQPPAK
jgi:hypothetical protein